MSSLLACSLVCLQHRLIVFSFPSPSNFFHIFFLSFVCSVRCYSLLLCQISNQETKNEIYILFFLFIFYLHFFFFLQNFLAANSQCWWNGPLTAATRALKYAGHVAPGMLLVTAEPCALEVLRGAYARSVLKPPATYVISAVGKSQISQNK